MQPHETYINSTNCTVLFKKKNIPYETVEITGTNSGTMLSGRIETDVIARHRVFRRAFRPLPEAQARAFLSLLQTNEFATVGFYDPETGTDRQLECIYTIPTMTYRLTDRYGVRWFELSDLQLTERG